MERVFDVLMLAVLGLLALPFVLGAPPWIYPVIVIPIVFTGIFFLVLVLTGKLTAENSRRHLWHELPHRNAP